MATQAASEGPSATVGEEPTAGEGELGEEQQEGDEAGAENTVEDLLNARDVRIAAKAEAHAEAKAAKAVPLEEKAVEKVWKREEKAQKVLKKVLRPNELKKLGKEQIKTQYELKELAEEAAAAEGVMQVEGEQLAIIAEQVGGPGGLTREVETPLPSNHPDATNGSLESLPLSALASLSSPHSLAASPWLMPAPLPAATSPPRYEDGSEQHDSLAVVKLPRASPPNTQAAGGPALMLSRAAAAAVYEARPQHAAHTNSNPNPNPNPNPNAGGGAGWRSDVGGGGGGGGGAGGGRGGGG